MPGPPAYSSLVGVGLPGVLIPAYSGLGKQTGQAFDTVLTTDLALAGHTAIDHAFTTDLALVPHQRFSENDVVDTVDQVFTPAQARVLFDQALTYEAPQRSAIDFVGTEDHVSELILFAAGPGFIDVELLLITVPVAEGTAVVSTATFTIRDPDSNAQVLIDPGQVTLVFRPGTGSADETWVWGSSGSIIRNGVGVYQALLDTAGAPGGWRVLWKGTEPCAAIGQRGFLVTAPPL